jgi:MYXO-CTERM domain-containing protein
MQFRSTALCALAAGALFFSGRSAFAATPGCSAQGPLNPAFPQHLLIGIAADSADDTWAATSGTKWDSQWVYFSGQAGNNWYNGFGYSPADGSWVDSFFTTIDSYGFIPGIHLYNMGYGHAGGDSGILTEVQDSSWTKEYFTEFKALMTHAKSFGKPVIVMLEGDSFGYLELLSNNDPTVMAAVASTGMPELQGLPNTLAGFGMAFLAIRKSVGAYNVAMGPDTAYWAANGDIMNFPPADTDPLQSHVDHQWQFFGSFVGPNQTGDRFDFSASCPDSGDCKGYTDGRPCWDPSDTASVNTPSINRYIQWLQLYNQKSGVRWLLTQTPLGNSQHRNVPFDGTPRSGYGDNHAEYLFQVESPASTTIRDTHLANYANAGVWTIWFGNSDDGDTPATDLWKDNQPFLKTHVALVNNNGGFAIGGSNSVICGGDGGATQTGSGSSSVGGTSGGSSSRGASTSGASGASGSSGSASRGGVSGSSASSGRGQSSSSTHLTGTSGGASNGGTASHSGGCSVGSVGTGGSIFGFAALALGLVLRRRRQS